MPAGKYPRDKRRYPLDEKKEILLNEEINQLRNKLKAIRDCHNPKCFLCDNCCRAAGMMR